MSDDTTATFDQLNVPDALKCDNVDRRFEARWPPSVLPPVRAIRLGGRSGLSLVNVARTGALFVGDARMTPGAILTLRLVTAGSNVLVHCQVVRCEIARLGRHGVTYYTAVSFNEELRLLDEAVRNRTRPLSWDSVLQTSGSNIDAANIHVAGLLGS